MFIGKDMPGMNLNVGYLASLGLRTKTLKQELEEIVKKINADCDKRGWNITVKLVEDESRLCKDEFALRISGNISPGEYRAIPYDVPKAGILIAETIKRHLPKEYQYLCPNFSIYQDSCAYVVEQI